MWTYSQTTGQIKQNGLLEGEGYSGHGAGLDNPAMEVTPCVGPIPQGHWKILRWDEKHGNKGTCVGVLAPVDHDAHGRTAFLIHGDNADANHTASDGCIIVGPNVRRAWRDSNDTELEVCR